MQNNFSVTIKDEDFLKKVANDEISFAKNDILVCEIRIKQWQIAEGLKTDYELLKVIEHRPSFKRMKLL